MNAILRIILFVVLGVLVWRGIKKMLRLGRGADAANEKPRALSTQDMVACSVCNLHLPASEAKYKEGLPFCAEHA